jgi:hypothetical protein
MELIEKLQEKLGIQITDDFPIGKLVALECSAWNTADGYEIYVMCNDPQNIDWDNEVYYYQPSFDEIISKLEELEEGELVYIEDIEEYLPEYEIEQWLEEKENEE